MNATEPTAKYYTFQDLLDKDGYFIFTNVGFSMMPLLRQKRDIIEIKRKEPGRCNKYDVVLYKRKDRYILHRIIKVLPDRYYIAGDNCTVLEKDIKDENILGVMTRVIRNGKTSTPDNIWYKLYVHLWCDFYPIRFFLLIIKRFLYRCISYVKRRVFR